MLPIDPDELLRFATRLDGKTLCTLYEGKPFAVTFDDDEIVFTPDEGSGDRPHGRKNLKAVCERFSETNSFAPSDYQGDTVNASYTLAVIAKYLGAIADGEIKPAGRHRMPTK